MIRDGQENTHAITPYYDGEFDRYRLGYQFEPGDYQPRSVAEAADDSVDFMWLVTSETVSTFAQIFKPEQREQISARSPAPYEGDLGTRSSSAPPRRSTLIAVICLSLGDHQPLPVPAARRRPHLLDHRREGPRQAASRSR